MTRYEKPTAKIRSPQKLSVGAIALLLSLVLGFVFMEERQRGLTIVIAIPWALCVVYFVYLWLIDRDAIKRYRRYLNEIRKTAKASDSKYHFTPKEDVLVSSPGETKNFVFVLWALVFIATLATFATRSRMGWFVFLLDAGLLVAYVWLEDQEAKIISEEIDYIEKLYPPDSFLKGTVNEGK